MIKPMKLAIKEEVEPGNVAWVFPVRQKCGGRPEASCRKQNRRAKGLTSKEMSYINAKLPKTEEKSIRRPQVMFRLNKGPIPCFLQVAPDFNRTMFRLERMKIEAKGGTIERQRQRQPPTQRRGREPGGA